MVEEGIGTEIIAEVCHEQVASVVLGIIASSLAVRSRGRHYPPVESGALPSSSETLGVPFGSLSVNMAGGLIGSILHCVCL